MSSIKDNFDLIVHNFEKEITVVPISDCHIGHKDCMINELKKVIKYIEENDNVYCTLGGDIIDNAVLTGKNLGIYDADMTPMKSIEYAVELFRPIKDKILGVVSGNHEYRSEKVTDTNPLYLLCCELQIQEVYRDAVAIIKVNVGKRNSTNQCYTILLHHGKGTSKSSIDKDREFMLNFSGVDICVTGHTHQGRVAKFGTYEVNKSCNRVSYRKISVVVTNSFLKDADYALRGMMVGCVNDIITFDLKLQKTKEIRIHY